MVIKMRNILAALSLTTISISCFAQTPSDENICNVSKKYAKIAFNEKLKGIDLESAVNSLRPSIENSDLAKTLTPHEITTYTMFAFNTFDSVYASKLTTEESVVNEANEICVKNINNAKIIVARRIYLCEYMSGKFSLAKELKKKGYTKAFAMESASDKDQNLNGISEYAIAKTYNEINVENIEAEELKICMRKINEK